MTGTLLIPNDPPYGTERSHNALRLRVRWCGGQARRRGAEVGVCGNCMDARGITKAELAPGTRRSSLSQPTDCTVWADRTLVF